MSSADRVRAYRKRQKTGESIPLCVCGKQLRGKLSRSRGICSECWKRSEAGKAETRDRVRRLDRYNKNKQTE